MSSRKRKIIDSSDSENEQVEQWRRPPSKLPKAVASSKKSKARLSLLSKKAKTKTTRRSALDDWAAPSSDEYESFLHEENDSDEQFIEDDSDSIVQEYEFNENDDGSDTSDNSDNSASEEDLVGVKKEKKEKEKKKKKKKKKKKEKKQKENKEKKKVNLTLKRLPTLKQKYNII